jgi:hypothetical protein
MSRLRLRLDATCWWFGDAEHHLGNLVPAMIAGAWTVRLSALQLSDLQPRCVPKLKYQGLSAAKRRADADAMKACRSRSEADCCLRKE